MEKNTLTKEQLKAMLGEILEKHAYATKKEDGYEVQLYVDYRDELSERRLQEISNYEGESKMEHFYNVLEGFVMEMEQHEFNRLFQTVKKNWDEATASFDDYEDDIIDILQEMVEFNFPYDRYLDQTVYVNILVNTGDGNYDFTLNNFASYNRTEGEDIEEESSLLWLIEAQGYTKDDLQKAVNERDFKNSVLLKTVVNESMHVTTHMNALAFFVEMTLKQFIDLTDKQQSITLRKDTSCGLYDCWSGAGGTLELTLEKDITLPSKLVEPHIDGARGYGIDEIYGMLRRFWKASVISLNDDLCDA